MFLKYIKDMIFYGKNIIVVFLHSRLQILYRQANANVDFDKNMLLLKNPQFLPDHYETLSKLGTHSLRLNTKITLGHPNLTNLT